MIDTINGYIEQNTIYRSLTLVCTDECKDTLKMYEELRNKTRDIIRSVTDNSDNYD